MQSPYPGSSFVLLHEKIPPIRLHGRSNALRVTAFPGSIGERIQGRWTMMVDSSNDLGVRMSLRKTRAGEASGGTRTRRRILSRFLTALPVDLSFSHNRPARSGYSGAHEEKRSSFSHPRILLRQEESARKGGVERLIFAARSFLLKKSDPIFRLGSM